MTNTLESLQNQSNPSSMAQAMRVSIIVPTFNRANYIAECLDSLLNQTMPALEIIVIDDGSEDGTSEIVQRYGQRIRYVRKENGGKPAAVNLGLSLAHGELIWIFDDDDVALPRAIENRVKVLQERPEAGFVFSPHYYGTDGPDGRIQQGRLHTIPSYSADNFFFELMKGCFFHLATALVRADVYRSVGGFDAELLRSQDYDMQLRLAQTCQAVSCSEPSFVFRQHDGVRGAKKIRFSVDQRDKLFHQFDQRIGRKLRANLQLGEFLVPARQEGQLDANGRRQALLGRMTVMGSKACLPEMAEDLQDYLATLPSGTLPSARERLAIMAAVCTGYTPNAIANRWNEFRELLARLPSSSAGRQVRRSIATGMFRLAKGYPGSLTNRAMWLKRSLVVLFR